MLPGAPANLGTHQFSTVLGLSLYGVSQPEAAGFSLVVFTVLTAPLMAIGLAACVSAGLTWSGIRHLAHPNEQEGTARTVHPSDSRDSSNSGPAIPPEPLPFCALPEPSHRSAPGTRSVATSAAIGICRRRELEPDRGFEIFVIATDYPGTLAAVRTAGQLARDLSARIRLVALQCVPYPREYDEPPVSPKQCGAQLTGLVERCGSAISNTPLAPMVEIRFCRDDWQELVLLLAPHSVVVIGKRTPWWPKQEDRLARRLRKQGHHVIRAYPQSEEAHG